MADGYVIPLAIPGGGASYATPQRNQEAIVAAAGYMPSNNPSQTGLVGNILNGKTTIVLVAVIALLLVLKWK